MNSILIGFISSNALHKSSLQYIKSHVGVFSLLFGSNSNSFFSCFTEDNPSPPSSSSPCCEGQ